VAVDSPTGSEPSQGSNSNGRPTLRTISTNPASPVQYLAFSYTLEGQGFVPSNVVVLVRGPHCSPCRFGSETLTTRTIGRIVGGMNLAPGTFTFTVRNGAGAESNGLRLVIR
jgi:hypothetical protein